MDGVTGKAMVRHVHTDRPRGVIWHTGDEISAQPACRDLKQSTLAAIIFADGTHHEHVMPKLGGMQGKVQRRAAKKLTAVDQVPEDFPNADDLHGLRKPWFMESLSDKRLSQ